MGNIHNELRRTPLSGALTRALGSQKGTEGLERFGETMQPVMDLWALPEWNYLRKDFLLCTNAQASAVVGEMGFVALGSPPTGRLNIIVVESITFGLGAAGSVVLRLSDYATVSGTGTPMNKGVTRDTRTTRSSFFPGGGGTIFQGTDVGALGFSLEQGLTAGATTQGVIQVALPYILAPGAALVVQAEATNQAISANFGWRERAAYPGELD